MAQPSPIQFAAQAYQSLSLPLDAQVCINMYVEKSPPDAKTMVPIFGCPGIDPWISVGNGPIIGLYVFQGNLLVVSGQQLYSVTPAGTPTLIGSMALVRRPLMTDNGTQVVFVDGQTGWIYQPGGVNFETTTDQAMGSYFLQFVTASPMAIGDTVNITLDDASIFTTTITAISFGTIITLASPLPGAASTGAIVVDPSVIVTQITSPNFYPANTVCYFDQYFVFDRAGTKQYFLSALGDGTQYNGLDTATAETNPGYLVAVLQLHEMLNVLTSQVVETWYDAGALDFPFQRFDGGTIQRGLAGPQAFVKEDNTFFWLGDDIIMYRLQGFTPQRISTHALEKAWQAYPTVMDAFAMSVTWNGHKWIIVTFPSGKQTWVYDVATGLWHQRVSWNGLNQDIGGWVVNAMVPWSNHVVVGDSQTGQLGFLDDRVQTEWGRTMPAIVTSPPRHIGRNRVFFPIFELDVESGVGTGIGQGALDVTYGFLELAQMQQGHVALDVHVGGAIESAGSKTIGVVVREQ